MSSKDGKEDSLSATGDKKIITRDKISTSPTDAQHSEESSPSSEVGSGDTKTEKEDNTIAIESENPKLDIITEIKHPLAPYPVDISKKSVTHENILKTMSVVTSNTTKSLDDNQDSAFTDIIVKESKLDVNISQDFSNSMEMDDSPEKSCRNQKNVVEKLVSEPKIDTAKKSNDSYDDVDLELKWDEDDENCLTEDALKILDQELGIDDMMSKNNIESKKLESTSKITKTSESDIEMGPKTVTVETTTTSPKNDTLNKDTKNTPPTANSNKNTGVTKIEDTNKIRTPTEKPIGDGKTSVKDAVNVVNIDKITKNSAKMDIDQVITNLNDDKITTQAEKLEKNETESEVIEKMGMDSVVTYSSTNTPEVETSKKENVEICKNDSRNLDSESTENFNKDDGIPLQSNVPKEGLVKVNLSEVKDIKAVQAEDLNEPKLLTDDSLKVSETIDVNYSKQNATAIHNTEIINESKKSVETENLSETNIKMEKETETHNQNITRQTKGMKTDLGFNKPNVMLEIPTQELIDFDDLDESSDNETNELEKEPILFENENSSLEKTLDTFNKGPEKELDSAEKGTDSIEEELETFKKGTESVTKIIIQESKTEGKDLTKTVSDKSIDDKESTDIDKEIRNDNITILNTDKSTENLKSGTENVQNNDEKHNSNELPSTSNDENMLEEPEISDTLGLLAESSRIIDDDSDDFDQDDESSYHMTGDHSEESNPAPSETDAAKYDEKETATGAQCEDNDEAGIEIVVDIVCKKKPKLSKRRVKDSTAKKGSMLKKLLIQDGTNLPIVKKTPTKATRLSVSTKGSTNVISFVDLEESSDEDVQEGLEETETLEMEKEDFGDTTKEIANAEENTVKAKPAFKMTKLNTSEVSIKTGASTKPRLIIPEITNIMDTYNVKKQTDTQTDEVLTLDTDTEDEKDISQTIEKEKKQVSKYNSKCINLMCTTSCDEDHYEADAGAVRYFGPSKRRAICEPCLLEVQERNQALVNGIKDFTPLFELNMDKRTIQLVEISDSESEDESHVIKECKELIGDKEANIINEKLVDLINDAWQKFNMDERWKASEEYISKELQKLEAEGEEVKQLLDDCQDETDYVRFELYETFDRESKHLPPLTIYDTPTSSYTCLEKDAPVSTNPTRKTYGLPPRRNRRAKQSYDVLSKTDIKEEKQDDDRDVSVVLLSAESAPAELPPVGEVVRPPLRVGMPVHAMKNVFGNWLRGKIIEITPKTSMQQYTHCHVKFDHPNLKNPIKLLPARCIAYQEPCNVRMTIGTRVLALFRHQNKRESFFSGVIAEIPNPVNNYRYLVFFDDGYAQYVKHQDTRLVCESKSLVWEEVHPFVRDFVKDYLMKYPERPMVRLHPGQRLSTEWNGKWWSSKVLKVDASLAQVHFEEDDRTEWIYRGSTRLRPLYLELQAAERHRTRLPRSKAQYRTNMPYVEYMRSDEQTKAQQQERQRAVAKKSTALPQAAPVEDKIDIFPSRVVYYTPKHAVKPYKMVPHTCAPSCKRKDVLTLKELRTYNPLAKPLLSGWERLQVRYRGMKAIMYKAPCGRRLRDIKELHEYLRMIDSELPVDLFDFNTNTHCLAEFVLNKYKVMKKDLSHGKENVPVPCVNYYDDSLPEFCSYNTERTPTAGVPLNLDPDFLCGCDCEDDCQDKTKCACWKMTLEGARTIGLEGDVGYVYRRLPEPLPSGIYECNSRCKCKSTCLNRVAQQPLQLKLQVFKTLKRGWGIRALNDVPKGSFLCVYAGNLLTDATANLDGLNEGDEYLAELDYIEVVEQMKEGYEEDIPEADKKLDKNDPKSKSDTEEEEKSESDNETNDSDKMDDDFQPGYIGFGLTEFNKRLRKRSKKKQNEEEKTEKEVKKEEDEQKTDTCITISDDEEVREPSRFTAQAGMGDKSFISKYRSVRSLFGKDEACYIMDAKVQGNIGRYLNHSCCPNVFVQNVFVDTHDPRFPWVAFFALTHVRAGAELTWNYNYDVGSVPGKVLYCYCGAPNCRGRLL